VTDQLVRGSPDLKKLGGTPSLPDYLRSLWRRREFALETARGELRSKHMDSVLGGVWHVLNPILLTAVYFVIFGLVLQISRGHTHFIGFLTIGVFTYSFIQRAVTSGAGSLVTNQGLIRSLQFPRALLPIAAVWRESLAFGWSLLVMVTVVLIHPDERLTWWWLVYPAILLLQVMFATGLALFVARLTDQARDVEQVLPYVFRLGFYFSGVLFSVERFVTDEMLQRIFILNPFYVFVMLPREYLMVTETVPDIGLVWLSALLWAPLMLLAGVLFFRGGEARYGRG
jgi:teichoic acid transport system permease protein